MWKFKTTWNKKPTNAVTRRLAKVELEEGGFFEEKDCDLTSAVSRAEFGYNYLEYVTK
jgi:hypothetical protein